jgi:hypothetical protein
MVFSQRTVFASGGSDWPDLLLTPKVGRYYYYYHSFLSTITTFKPTSTRAFVIGPTFRKGLGAFQNFSTSTTTIPGGRPSPGFVAISRIRGHLQDSRPSPGFVAISKGKSSPSITSLSSSPISLTVSFF